MQRGDLIWIPPADVSETTVIGRFISWLDAEGIVTVNTYEELWRWSVGDLQGFWRSVWQFFGVRSSAAWTQVLDDQGMPGVNWFEGARLNYAEHVLRFEVDGSAVALVGHSQTRPPVTLTFAELASQVASARAGLEALGVGPGDRVVGYLPNIPEAVVAFLATSSLGAVWAACAPELGQRAVLDRFAQLEPTVLLAVAGYRYGDTPVDRSEVVDEVRRGLPTLQAVVDVPYAGSSLPDAVPWAQLLATPAVPSFRQVPFSAPLYILFSSGTTGPPKPIVHGHGGVLLEHLKNHGLSWDLQPGDRLMFFTTTTWMVWNAVVSSLLTGASAVLLDGNPLHPNLDEQWRLAAELGVTHLGASPGYLMACREAGLEPPRDHDLGRLRQLCVGGSPLPVAGYTWIHDQFGQDVLLNVGSGGTDITTSLVQGSPLQPVWAGEMSGRCLAVDAHAFDEEGRPVVGVPGELVVTSPMPSMPVGFWDDPDDHRYRATYFDRYPGVWHHGDWITFTERGSCLITGRSDATLNRGGVRLGTNEFYRVVEELEEVRDSLVVHLDTTDERGLLVLYVVLEDGTQLGERLRRDITAVLRTELSPRHVPDLVRQLPNVPRSPTGKKLEVPVKRLLQGTDADAALGHAMEDSDDPVIVSLRAEADLIQTLANQPEVK